MSTNWTDPTGDDYQKYTGEQRPGGPAPRPASGQPPGQDHGPAQPPPSGAGWTGPGWTGPGASPQDAPLDTHPGHDATAGYPPPPQGYPGPGGTAYPGPGGTAYPGQPYPAYGPPGYQPPTHFGPAAGMSSPYASTVPLHSGSAITLLILSIALTFFGCGLGIPSLVMSIVALSKGSRDGDSANRTVRAGWITFAVLAVLAALFWVVVLVSGLSAG